ncbi:MAG: glycosyltransferase [Myxococcota bacterium]
MGDGGRLRILHAVSPASVGGLERVVHALAGGMAGRGHEVHVASLVAEGDPGEAFRGPLEAAGVSVHSLAIRTLSVLREHRFVQSLCRQLRPDVVHTHGYRPDIVDARAARRLGIPTLSTEHGMSKMGGRTAVYEWLQLRALRRFDGVVAVSAPIARTLEASGVDPDRIELLPNAWAEDVVFRGRGEARRELGLPDEGPVVGWVGRLIGAKGGDVFLRALAGSASGAPASIVGEGPERAAWSELAAGLGLADRVRFHGEVQGAARLLPAFDVFVLSSRTEGTPIVLLEAIASGVPIVATAVGGVPDVLGEDGALVVPAEDPGALAAAVDEVLADPEAGRERTRRARARVAERHGLAAWLDRYESLYRRLACQRRAT